MLLLDGELCGNATLLAQLREKADNAAKIAAEVVCFSI